MNLTDIRWGMIGAGKVAERKSADGHREELSEVQVHARSPWPLPRPAGRGGS